MPSEHRHDTVEVADAPSASAITPADLDASMFPRALGSVMDELLAIDAKRLAPVNVDVPAAILVVIGAGPGLRALRPEIAKVFGEEMASAVDRLELLAHAVGEAEGRYRAGDPGDDLQALADSVADVRTALIAEVASLGARKLVNPRSVGRLRGGRGYKGLAFDAVQLIAFLDKHWSVIEHATRYTKRDLERVEALANALITTASVRAQGGASPTENVRQRAFTLLRETYDDVRAMVAFVRRRQGDADRIARSLYVSRKR